MLLVTAAKNTRLFVSNCIFSLLGLFIESVLCFSFVFNFFCLFIQQIHQQFTQLIHTVDFLVFAVPPCIVSGEKQQKKNRKRRKIKQKQHCVPTKFRSVLSSGIWESESCVLVIYLFIFDTDVFTYIYMFTHIVSKQKQQQ